MFLGRWTARAKSTAPRFVKSACFSSHSAYGAALEEAIGKLDGFVPASTYASLLRKCADARALEQGKRLHAQIVESGQIHDRLLANMLVVLYGKCGEPDEAYQVFQQILQPNIISWTVLITAFAQNGHCREALHFFRCMDLEGTRADSVTFSAALEACSSQELLEEGKQLHSAIVGEGFEADAMVQNNLVIMYGKCGSLENAQLVFQSMMELNVVSWNVMISAYVQNDQGREAVRLWKQMHLEGVKPDRISFVTFIDACANVAALNEGTLAHLQIANLGFESNRVVGNTLLNLYGKCGKLDFARQFFEKLENRDVVSWNTMISAFVLHDRNEEAFELFRMMDVEGVQPTRVTFVTALDACWKLEQVDVIRELIRQTGVELDDVVGRALINAYRACGSLVKVRSVFTEVCERHKANVHLWNGMLAAFCEQGYQSLELFRQMQQGGFRADKLTLISVLDACVSLTDLKQGELVHDSVVELGLEQDMYVQTALVNMYGKCGKLEEARSLFDRMRVKDLVAWNAMLAAYVQKGSPDQATQLFLQMDLQGENLNIVTLARVLDACGSPESLRLARALHAEACSSGNRMLEDDFLPVGNALLNVYGKCQLVNEAASVFDRMSRKDDVSFNIMMAAFAQTGQSKDCLRVFHQMQHEGFKPSNISFVSVLDACTDLAALSSGKAIHSSIVTSGLDLDLITETALVNMYGKCGSLDVAWNLFHSMKNQRDLVSWNTVVAVYAQHGNAGLTLNLFRKMQQDGVKPDGISFLETMAACSHSGLLEQAFELFASMSQDHGLAPTVTHFGCMVDLLGRSSRLKEAEELISKMPCGGAESASWKIFLNACKEQGDDERGERAAELAMRFEPGDNMPYVLLANLYVQNRRNKPAEAS